MAKQNFPAIEARGLVRRFGEREALADVSFEVVAGEVFGVLGPNGAGKTTTVRVLNGMIAPHAGESRVCGLDPRVDGDAVRARTGVLTEQPAIYEPLTGRANLAFFGKLRGFSGHDLDRAVDAALGAVGLLDRADTVASTYSKGMKQRLAIARAVMHRPEVLFLDEPTTGLDPVAAEQIAGLVRAAASEGRAVYLCTHLLNEAERLCRRYALFDRGRVLACGTKAELAARVGLRAGVTLGFAGPPPNFPALPGELGRDLAGERLRLRLDASDRVPDVVAAVVAAGGRLMAVEPDEATLEELYFALMAQVAV